MKLYTVVRWCRQSGGELQRALVECLLVASHREQTKQGSAALLLIITVRGMLVI